MQNYTNSKTIKAVIFDLDGVLIRSELKTFKLLKNILKNYNIELKSSSYPLRVGKKISVFLKEVYGNILTKKVEELVLREFYKEYKSNPLDYISEIPITVQFIKSYVGPVRFAIASVSSKEEILSILEKLSVMDKFSVIVSSDDVHNLKPYPDIYKKTLKLLHLKPNQCIAIEDSRVGALSAITANIPTYGFINAKRSFLEFDKLKILGTIKKRKDILSLIKNVV